MVTIREIKSGQFIVLFVLIILACGCIEVVDDKVQIVENKTLAGEDGVVAVGDKTQSMNDTVHELNTTPTTTSLKSNEVRIIVCKNFGSDEIVSTIYELSEGDSAMDALQSVADVDTAYNGGFVNSISNIRSGYTEGTKGRTTKTDWFYYINGILANSGSLDYTLHGGDVERWDQHDWSYQLFIPAIIGDYPEPFLHGINGNVLPTVIAYDDYKFRDDADEIKNSLVKLGVKDISVKSPGNLSDSLREQSNIILIGYPGNELINELMENHKKLGFFAYFEDNSVVILDPKGKVSKKSGGAIILATQNPWNPKGTGAFENVAWIITGTGDGDIEDAADILSKEHELLRNYFGAFIYNKEVASVPCT